MVTFFWPGITSAALLYLIAGWSFLTGIGVILGVFQAREESAYEHQWLLGLISLNLTGLGVAILFLPDAGERTIIGVFAAFSILVGIVLLAFRLRLRSWYRNKAAMVLP